jgi:acetylornithine/succinyldiaminopimelate/putrescine aminotransferase
VWAAHSTWATNFCRQLRKRCDETGALLIFDEVQCGVGRTGQPFAANYYGVMPDMITTAKALGNGFPVSALLLTPPITASLKLENLGTTFGGGPMACAVAEATIDAIEQEDLLANVRRVSAYLTKTCAVGPVTGFQGLGFLAGLKMNKPAKDIQKALLARDILAGHCRRSVDPAAAPRVHPQRGAR